MGLILSVFEQGMIYAIMGLGVYITYKILDFPDLTVDGKLPARRGYSRSYDLSRHESAPGSSCSVRCGSVVGFLTGLIHVKLKCT